MFEKTHKKGEVFLLSMCDGLEIQFSPIYVVYKFCLPCHCVACHGSDSHPGWVLKQLLKDHTKTDLCVILK